MNFDDSHIDSLAELLAEAAESEIMPRFRRLSADDVRRKTSRADLVTDADVGAERQITAALHARYPEALVVGEEAVSADPRLLDGLASADLAFTIDPVDGTFNFASGLPLFGVMLAVAVKGETVAGIIHDPIGRDCILAGSGAGAFVRDAEGGRTRMQVADPVPVSEMTGSLSWQYLEEPERGRVARNQTKCLAPMNYRCAAHEYRMLSEGHADFACYTKLMPWDHLPGVLIHAEAGGYSAKLDGEPYRVGDTHGRLLAAADRQCWLELKRALWEE
jgi:fructose-1,6-bisphosphatase/inositol monophosphatase family enzyme